MATPGKKQNIKASKKKKEEKTDILHVTWKKDWVFESHCNADISENVSVV